MESVTYAELRVLVEKYSSALRSAGVVIGDRVAGKLIQYNLICCPKQPSQIFFLFEIV